MLHALVTYLVKGSAYVLANEFVAFITFYVRKINVCLTINLFVTSKNEFSDSRI